MGLLEETLRGRSLADYTNSELKIALNTALYTNTADMWSRYLVQQGYSGSVADMMAKWWAANNVPPQFRNYINSGLYLFNPGQLFQDGSIGVLYDNNDLTSFYLDAAGTTPATVNGLVGLQLDKSQGLVLGAELVTNGDFSNGTTGWTAFNSTLSESGGVLRVTENGVASAGFARQSFTVVAGRSYRVSVDITTVAAAKAQIWIGSSYGGAQWLLADNITTPRTLTAVFIATTTTAFFELVMSSTAGGTTEYAEFDNISVKELPGNHRYQTTTGFKPVLRGTPVGSSLVTNGDFASSTGWTLASGCSITGGALVCATASPGTSFRSITVNASSRTFLTEFTLSGRTSGDAVLRLYKDGVNVTTSSTYRAANGRYVAYITTSDQPNRVVLEIGSSGLNASIDDVAVYDVSAGQVTAPYGLQYDGVDDFLQTASVNFSATDKMFVCAGVRKLSDASIGMLVETGATAPFSTNNTFGMYAPVNAGTANYGLISRGTSPAQSTTTSTFAAPVTSVITGITTIATDTAIVRVNGVQDATSASDQGTGNYSNLAIYFGRRGGTTLPFNGLDFGFVIVGKTLTSAQISSTERYIAQRTGVSI